VINNHRRKTKMSKSKNAGRRGINKAYSVVTKDGLKISRIIMSRKVFKEALESGDKLTELK